MNVKKILLIEGATNISDDLHAALKKAGYTVDVAMNAETASCLFSANAYDLLLLDEHLPDMKGCELCDHIRKVNPSVPVIMISSVSSGSLLESFESGADDFVLLSGDLRELVLRISALERRCRQAGRRNHLICAADIAIDTDSKEVWRMNRAIRLSAGEFNLLYLLVSNKNRVVPTEDIIKAIWGNEPCSKRKRVTAFITSLRKKIGDDAVQKCIYTVTGKGYVFTEKRPR
ncbi:MAG: response regulator transcription factor [Bacteroidetes bacterium]|nr:response regulator transcription factor [Bacteroidota bacterium]